MKAALIMAPLLAGLLLAGTAKAQPINHNNNTKNKELTMSTMEKNKEVIQQIYSKCLSAKNWQLLHEYIADEYVGVLGKKGADGFSEPVMPLVKSFPDMQWEVQKMVAEGDQVAVWWKLQGTHTGVYKNAQGTGKIVTNEGFGIFELKNGKVISTHVLTDRLGFLQQMNVLPADINQLKVKDPATSPVSFIDKFIVPAAAKAEFLERVHINRNLIKQLPGFIEDAAYENTDADGNLVLVTMAQWESQEALNKAKEVVQAEYKKQGFNLPDMLQRLHITIDRGVYAPSKN